MNDLLAMLVCPSCHAELELIPLADGQGKPQETSSPPESLDVTTGIFACRCGAIYPLIDGVPRLFTDSIASFPSFVSEHQAKIREICGDRPRTKLPPSAAREEDEYANIRKSFSQEWSIFDYDNDKTWGWSLAERKKVFLGDVQMHPDDLVGKRLLDAGCGNGTLSAALTDFGLHVVGLDLNDGLGLAYRNRHKYGEGAGQRVRYVQGNLVEPPFKEGSYDIVYSSGVIHHTPSSKHSFGSLSRMVKPGGRLYVWVYGKRAWPVRLFFAGGRTLNRVLSLQSLMVVCRGFAPVYKVAADALNALGLLSFRRRTSREITLDLFDAFAPRYNHWHTEAEVQSWFKEYGFENVNVSGVQKHGFGMYGDKI